MACFQNHNSGNPKRNIPCGTMIGMEENLTHQAISRQIANARDTFERLVSQGMRELQSGSRGMLCVFSVSDEFVLYLLLLKAHHSHSAWSVR